MLTTRSMVLGSALVASVVASNAVAAPVALLISSSATLVHSVGAGGTSQRTVSLTAIPEFGVLNPTIPLQLPNGNLTAGAASSTAKGGIGLINTGTFLGIAIATTSSVTQRGNTLADPLTASSLTINYTATWQLGQNLGPNTAGASVAVVGSIPLNPPPGPNIPSATAFAAVDVLADFAIASAGGGPTSPFRSSINQPNFVSTNIQGPYSLSSSNISDTNPAVFNVTHVVTISGSFTFRVHNDGTEASLEVLPGTGNSGPFDPEFTIPGPGASAGLVMVGLIAARRRRA